MSHFALLWKARTIEKYRHDYESEKINSILMANTEMPKQSLSQRWRHYRYDTRKRLSRTFRKWYPEGSMLSNLLFYLKTDQTFPNFVLKSVLGFVGGIVLTYLCFMFFVFQLSISLMHATIMSSVIGVLLTLGLAFSYRIRCLVFLLIPQFFSRVGRYSLTCYALVLILTGPATNTLKNSEVLSESLACGQEQIKTSVNQINSLRTKPLNSMKDSILLMIDKLKGIAVKLKKLTVKINRLVLTIAQVIRSGFLWLNSLSSICNKRLGIPYQRCTSFLTDVQKCRIVPGDSNVPKLCNRTLREICSKLKPDVICVIMEHLNGDLVPLIKKRLKNFSERITHMMSLQVQVHHSYSFSSNTSRSASQVAAGIVTEIRRRADPLLTWLSWSSCVTSLFLLLIIFRAKYYQHMFETRSRFDNRYITKEIRDLDLKRLREGRETILPLNRRERAKYVTTTSFRLVASEKVYLNRSVVFMSITTFKLLIHMIADYSLYWVLMTIRYHGRFQSIILPGPSNAGFQISGTGPTADLLKSILASLGILLDFPTAAPVSCLPNPFPPDFKRYSQIGVLIFLLWFFAMFEPYGLRLRHVVMGHYQPERAKARAVWLYNHILRTRGGFMKFARRNLHRRFKYRSEEMLAFRRKLNSFIPFSCLKYLFSTCPEELRCLLCGTSYYTPKSDTKLIRCKTSDCPGVYCARCFSDIGELCTICLSPKDYGDMSDVSLEKGSSEESDEDDEHGQGSTGLQNPISGLSLNGSHQRRCNFARRSRKEYQNFRSLKDRQDIIPLVPKTNRGNPNTPGDHNHAFKTKESPFKGSYLLIDLLIIDFHQMYITEREYAIFVCEYCNNQNCKNQLKLGHLNMKSLFLQSKNQSSDTTSGCDISNKVVNTLGKIITNLIEKAYCKNLKINEGHHGSKKNKIICKYCNNRNHNSFKRTHPISMHTKTIKYNKSLRTVSTISAKFSNYSISFKKHVINVEKTVQPVKLTRRVRGYTKLSVKNSKMALKVKSNDKAKRNNVEVTKCLKQLTENIPVYFGVQDHIGTPNKSNDSERKDSNFNKKRLQEKKTSATSNRSCHCIRKLRALFFDFWKYFKISIGILSCKTFSVKDVISPVADRKNHKRRKKKTNKNSLKSYKATVKSIELESNETQKYRISAFLNEQDWIKRQCKKVKARKILEQEAVIKSGSKNVVNKKKNKQEFKKEIESKPKVAIAKLVQELPAEKKHPLKEKIMLKNEITFSELWKKLGYGRYGTNDSSSSSFLNNILEKTSKIFGNNKNVGRLPSSDKPKRMKFHESVENDAVERNLHDNQQPYSMESNIVPKGLKITVKKYPYTDRSQRIHVLSTTASCIDDNELQLIDNLISNSSDSTYMHRLKRIKGCFIDRVRNSRDNSFGLMNKHMCKVKKPEASGGNNLKEDNQLIKDIDEGKKESLAKEARNTTESKVKSKDPTEIASKEIDVKTAADKSTVVCPDTTNKETSSTSMRKRPVTKSTEAIKQETLKLSKLVQVAEPGKSVEKEAIQAIILVSEPLESSKPIEEKSSTVTRELDDCPRIGFSDNAEEKAPKETCTCATQYLFKKDDNNHKRDIYEYSSTSFSGSDTVPSALTKTNLDSPETCTDATLMCSLALIDDKQERKSKRKKVKVVTKCNQCTFTEEPRLRDASTQDWWSPIVEKKKTNKEIPTARIVKELNKAIRFERTVTEIDREVRFDVGVKEGDREIKFHGLNNATGKRMGYSPNTMGDCQIKKTKTTKFDGRIVTFNSQAQIIPLGADDIMSPSRYLLESQRYYNELFTSKFYAPHLFPVNVVQKPMNGSLNCSPTRIHPNTRRHYKTKRLDECFSPRKQIISPRRRCIGYEWFRPNESGYERCPRKNNYRSILKSSKKRKHLRLKCEEFAHVVNNKELKFGVTSNDDMSLNVRCNSTSSF